MLYKLETYNSPNFESRGKFKPIMIINHITDGTEAVRRDDQYEETSVYNTFMNPSSQASSTITITRDGRIKQFVDIRNAAWTQGLHSAGEYAKALNPIVRQMGANPNLYCLSIEYDAYGDHGGDGNITDDQFWAGVWVHKWLQMEVQRIYGFLIQLNSTYVAGHCHVDPVNKPLCPGVNFPWARLYAELAIASNMTLEALEARIMYLRSDSFKLKKCIDVMHEIEYLTACANGEYNSTYGDWAVHFGLSNLRLLYSAFASQGVLEDKYSETDDYKLFSEHVEFLYACAMGKDKPEFVGWGIESMGKVYPFMLQNGLVQAS